MSYLNLPRLHFFGSFRAAPSTINNTDGNYQTVDSTQLGWNPMGAHQFQLLQGNEPGLPPGLNLAPCTVQSLCIKPGKYINTHAADSLVGGLVVSTNDPVPGKLVDLDPDQQGVSMIWGMKVGIGDPSGERVVGTFQPATFRQMWRRLVTSPVQGSQWFSALYQSILIDLQWPAKIRSPFLKALHATSPTELSIKFNVDLHDNNIPPTNPNPMFTIGRVAGTIGPALSGEARHFVLGRRMFSKKGVVVGSTTTPPPSPAELIQFKSGAGTPAAAAVSPAGTPNPPVPLNPLPFIVDTKNSRLVIDLGNSLPNDDDGHPIDMGTLQVIPAGGKKPIVSIDYSLANYQHRAYVYDVALSSSQLKTLSNTALQIVQFDAGGSQIGVAAAEPADGSCFDSDGYVYRMQPNTAEAVTFRAAYFGQQAPDGHNISILGVQTFAGAASTDVSFSQSTIPIQSGRATVTMTAGAPNPPRQSIDGQVYQVSYGLDGNQNPDGNAFLSVLTHAFVNIPANPTWETDVEPILSQYADLYPFMANIINLGDEEQVLAAKQAVIQRLTLPMTDPRYMPVVRDLSDAKRAIVLNWLNNTTTPPSGGGSPKSSGHGGGPVS
ncbi:MAG: hypothetical protein JWN02_2392 [Acidobacteria bacterium]|nr:hypothetical protein [Acidobacteriota bacterium]